MFLVHDLWLAIALCVVTMIGWGSWANTQKLAGKERWPFELYYWDTDAPGRCRTGRRCRPAESACRRRPLL